MSDTDDTEIMATGPTGTRLVDNDVTKTTPPERRSTNIDDMRLSLDKAQRKLNFAYLELAHRQMDDLADECDAMIVLLKDVRDLARGNTPVSKVELI